MAIKKVVMAQRSVPDYICKIMDVPSLPTIGVNIGASAYAYDDLSEWIFDGANWSKWINREI